MRTIIARTNIQAGIIGAWLLVMFFTPFAMAQSIPQPAPDASCASPKVFGNPQSIGGVALSLPSVEVAPDGRLIVVVRGTLSDVIWVREWRNGSILTDWYELRSGTIYGTTTGQVKMVKISGQLWVYAKGTDINQLVYRSRYISQGNWSAWEYSGFNNTEFGTAGPMAVTSPDGTYRVTGTDPVNIEGCVSQLFG